MTAKYINKQGRFKNEPALLVLEMLLISYLKILAVVL
jgi:hypothetical protein